MMSGQPSILSRIIGHDQGADQVDDDGGARKQGEEKKAYAKKGGIDVKVLSETSKHTEEPFVCGRFCQDFFVIQVVHSFETSL